MDKEQIKGAVIIAAAGLVYYLLNSKTKSRLFTRAIVPKRTEADLRDGMIITTPKEITVDSFYSNNTPISDATITQPTVTSTPISTRTTTASVSTRAVV